MCNGHKLCVLSWKESATNRCLIDIYIVLQVNHFRNQRHIHVYGTDIPEPAATFDQLQTEYSIDARIMSNIQSMGFHTPTVIEMQAIPIMLHVGLHISYSPILTLSSYSCNLLHFAICLTGLVVRRLDQLFQIWTFGILTTGILTDQMSLSLKALKGNAVMQLQ